MSKVICAIDQGTSSSRAILFDSQANVVAVAQKELSSYYPQPGWVEQNPEEIWASVVGVVYEALAKASLSMEDIDSFAITNQRETTIVFEKATGRPVHFALVWQSRQSAPLCEAKKEEGHEAWVYQRTGLVMDAYFSASKIRWILDHIPNGQKRAENNELAFSTVDSWLIYKLTQGKLHVTDATNASRTQLLNLKTGEWDEDCLKLWNIPACMLPEIKNTSEVVGYSASALFSRPIPIASMVGDQQAALFGQLCVSRGMVKNTYGTGCFLLMNTGDQPIQSKHGLLSTVAWKMNGKTTYALEGSVFMAGAAIQWLRDGLKLFNQASESESLALSVSDSEGVVVVPAFTGLGAPYWRHDVQGAILGLSRGSTKAHVTRATLESLAYQTYDVVNAMSEDAQMKIKALKVDGGASRNQFLMQFQADILNTAVARPALNETTALGAAFFAGLATGFYESVDQLLSLWSMDKMFEPSMDEALRLAKLDRWHKAVDVVCTFKS